ncbi:MAG: hypothetical protein ACLQVJ_06855 [Syntrophobacteraceae bacterium]
MDQLSTNSGNSGSQSKTKTLFAYGAIITLLLIVGLLAWKLVEQRSVLNKVTSELHTLKCPSEVQLEGEVFIVTKGEQNVKLGLVEVMLFPRDSLDEFIKSKKQEAASELEQLGQSIAKAQSEYDNPGIEAIEEYEPIEKRLFVLQSRHNYLLSDMFYFENLPLPRRSTKTNSDGHFTLSVPTDGLYAIVAQARRAISADNTETYHWLVQISKQDMEMKTLFLSNDNTTLSGSQASLIDARGPIQPR